MSDPKALLAQFQAKTVNVRWPEDPGEATMANVFAIQAAQDGIMMTIGQANPPIPFGPPEGHAEQAMSVDEVPAHVICRVVLTPHRIQELATALQQVLEQISMVPMAQLVPNNPIDKTQT